MSQKQFNLSGYEIQVARQDRAIAELRLAATKRRMYHLEFQNDWYEHAPLRWMLRKTVRAFDSAFSNRMSRRPHRVPAYDMAAQVSGDEDPAVALRHLSRSYQRSVSTVVTNGRGLLYYALLPSWFAYRLVRKTAKIIWRPRRRAL